LDISENTVLIDCIIMVMHCYLVLREQLELQVSRNKVLSILDEFQTLSTRLYKKSNL